MDAAAGGGKAAAGGGNAAAGGGKAATVGARVGNDCIGWLTGGKLLAGGKAVEMAGRVCAVAEPMPSNSSYE